MKQSMKIGCGMYILLVATVMIMLIHHHYNKPEPGYENCYREQTKYLDEQYFRFQKCVETVKEINVDYDFVWRHGGKWVSFYREVNDTIIDLKPLFPAAEDSLRKYEIYDFWTFVWIIKDSVLITFTTECVGLKENLITFLCYSEKPIEELSKYDGGTPVYAKDEKPDKDLPFLWQIRDNWYIYQSRQNLERNYPKDAK